MKQLMTACFWICIACIMAGAVWGLLVVWKVVEGPWVSQVWLSIAIVLLAAALTLSIGRTYLGKNQSIAPEHTREDEGS